MKDLLQEVKSYIQLYLLGKSLALKEKASNGARIAERMKNNIWKEWRKNIWKRKENVENRKDKENEREKAKGTDENIREWICKVKIKMKGRKTKNVNDEKEKEEKCKIKRLKRRNKER